MRGMATALLFVAILFSLYGCNAENRGENIVTSAQQTITDTPGSDHIAADTPDVDSAIEPNGDSSAGTTPPDVASSDVPPSFQTPDATVSNTVTPDLPASGLQFFGWEYFLNNDLQTAEYTGVWEGACVSFADFVAAAECDIDSDGENELILRYN